MQAPTGRLRCGCRVGLSEVHWLERHPQGRKGAIAFSRDYRCGCYQLLCCNSFTASMNSKGRFSLNPSEFAFAATVFSSLTYNLLKSAGLPHLNWGLAMANHEPVWGRGLFAARSRHR